MTGPRDSAMIRIMVVEDNVDYRTVIALAIDDATDMKLIGLFGTTEIALRTLETTRESEKPDILLLDLRLPGMSGLDALPLIHAASPATRIIILSQSDAPNDIVRAISSGVSGYLLKSARLKEITEAIRTVSQGGGSLDKNVAEFILEKMTTKELFHIDALTERENEILLMLSEGFVKKEIATQLGIGYSTVDTHVSHIYKKLGVSNAPAAVSKAYQ
ncbi:MAG: response regulator transcription factor, partial [Pirellulales bacterium]|nr:response regulator transcription factor [Pirellulales bacterium]